MEALGDGDEGEEKRADDESTLDESADRIVHVVLERKSRIHFETEFNGF